MPPETAAGTIAVSPKRWCSCFSESLKGSADIEEGIPPEVGGSDPIDLEPKLLLSPIAGGLKEVEKSIVEELIDKWQGGRLSEIVTMFTDNPDVVIVCIAGIVGSLEEAAEQTQFIGEIEAALGDYLSEGEDQKQKESILNYILCESIKFVENGFDEMKTMIDGLTKTLNLSPECVRGTVYQSAAMEARKNDL